MKAFFPNTFFSRKKSIFIRYSYEKNTAMTLEVNIEVYIEILIFHKCDPKYAKV